jgi:hypothetical protein
VPASWLDEAYRDGLNPNGFPVLGFANSSYPDTATYWTMSLTVAGEYRSAWRGRATKPRSVRHSR